MYVLHLPVTYMPHLATAVIGIYVSTHATSGVLVTMFLEYQFACSGITQVCTVWSRLMHHIKLKSGAIGVEIGEMEGITMSKTGGI